MTELLITRHAVDRCRSRSIPRTAVEAALEFGRYRFARGAEIYVLGWREVRFHAERGIDLSRWEGVEVVCAPDGRILTVYRNKNSRAFRDRPVLRRAA